MRRKLAVLDTNIYVDWLRHRKHEDLVLGRAVMLVMSSVVLMELRSGATTPTALRSWEKLKSRFHHTKRLAAPGAGAYERAGSVVARLRARGRDVSRASLLADVLIALGAREMGATVITQDTDLEVIRDVEPFALDLVRGG